MKQRNITLTRKVLPTLASERPVQIRNADVSGWAHATSKPFGKIKPNPNMPGGFCANVPDCAGPVLSIHNPIKSLGNIGKHGPFSTDPAPKEREIVTGACITKFDETEHAIKQTLATMRIVGNWESFYRRTVKKTGKPMEGPTVPKVTKGCGHRERKQVGKGQFQLKSPLPVSGCLSESELNKMRAKVSVPRG